MASDKQLLIEIAADDNGSAKVVNQNTKAINRLENSTKGASGAVVNYNKKQDRLRLSSGRSNQVLMNTGRIIQDLPYGFRGVANNIDPFIDTLQRAKAETGSYKTVAKSLLRSLTGPAGIAIGISTISSIILTFGPQIADFFGIFEDGKKKVDDAKDSIKTFGDQAKDVVDSSVSDLGLENKIKALKAARKQLEPVKGKNNGLKIPQNLQQKVNQQQKINALRIAGSQKAFAAYQQSKKDYKLDKKRKKKIKEILDNKLAELEANKLARKELAKIGLQEDKNNQALKKKLKILQDQRDALLNHSGNLSQAQQERLQGLGSEINRYQKIIAKRQQIANYDKLRAKSLKKANAELKKAYDTIIKTERKKVEAVETPIKPGKLDTSLPGQNRLNFNQYAGASGRLRQQLARYNEELARSNDLTQKQGENMLFQYKAADRLSQGLNQLRVEGFVQLGKTIGNVLSQDFHGNLFAGFQSALSNFMSTFGRQLIELGLGKIALDKLFAFPGGGAVAVAAGTALIALAQATKSKDQKRLNSITGGGSTRVRGYRGFDFSSGSAGFSGGGGGTPGPAASALGTTQKSGSRKIQITNGFGNIVATGQEEIDRKGGSNYLGGDS